MGVPDDAGLAPLGCAERAGLVVAIERHRLEFVEAEPAVLVPVGLIEVGFALRLRGGFLARNEAVPVPVQLLKRFVPVLRRQRLRGAGRRTGRREHHREESLPKRAVHGWSGCYNWARKLYRRGAVQTPPAIVFHDVERSEWVERYI